MMSNDGLIMQNMDLSHIHLAVRPGLLSLWMACCCQPSFWQMGCQHCPGEPLFNHKENGLATANYLQT